MNNKTNVLIIIFVFIFVLFLFISLSLFIIFVQYYDNNPEPISQPSSTFQYQEIHPLKGSKKGFVNMNRVLSSEDFLSYRNEETGSYTVISNFGSENYECTASCSCREMAENDRRFSSVLTRGLTLTFSAFSSAVALKIAQKGFEDYCLSEYEGYCEPDSIGAVDMECKEHIVMDWEGEWTNNDGKHLEYLCYGKCVPQQGIGDLYALPAIMDWGGFEDCDYVRLNGRIFFKESDFELANMPPPKYYPFDKYEEYATRKFVDEDFDPFCRLHSTVEYPDKNKENKKVSACVALYDDHIPNESDLKRGMPRHVFCYRDNAWFTPEDQGENDIDHWMNEYEGRPADDLYG